MAHEIVIPRLGWSMDEGTFVGWLKRDGDAVRAGEPLFELEGEKGIQEIESVDAGILRIPAEAPTPGSVVPVGRVIGYLTEAGEATPAVDAPAKPPLPAAEPGVLPPASPAARRFARRGKVQQKDLRDLGERVLVDDLPCALENAAPALAGRTAEPAVTAAQRCEDRSGPVASPRARRTARELSVDWRQLRGSGRGGRIRERDVRAAAQNGNGQQAPAEGVRIPLTPRRRAIAERMMASRQQTAPVTLTSRADASNLVNLREQFKAMGDASLIPSYQDVIVKLVAHVLERHPVLAGRWDGDSILLPAPDGFHVRIAVDSPAGLVAPVIRNAAALSLEQIVQASRGLIERVQSGRISVAELEGGVFTISNLGAFGVDAFTPIINLPEVAILGLGAIRREAIVEDDGQVTITQQMTLSLTFDHRVVDGAPAARFLQEVARAIANPSASLLSQGNGPG